jgi:alpha-L-fucosidase 2
MNEQGKIVARQMYNCSGTVTHHNTDLWGDSAPQDNYLSSTFWPLGSAWMVTHVIEYYRFTGNQTALQDMLDFLVGNAQFALDFLTPYEGYMVTNPSLSPENTYYLPESNATQVAITAGPTIDNSILWEMFGFIGEIEGLGLVNASLAQQVASMRAKLPPLRLNQYNGIAEWIQDYTEVSQWRSVHILTSVDMDCRPNPASATCPISGVRIPDRR